MRGMSFCYQCMHAIYARLFVSVPTLCFSGQMKDFLMKWDVLHDPTYGVMTMQEWRLLLEDESSTLNPASADMDPYQRLLWDVWLPPVRATIL